MIIALYSHGPGSGKSEVAKFLVGHGYQPRSFASPVKTSLATVLNALSVSNAADYLWGAKKEDKIPELGVTGRYLMSSYATEFFRDSVNPDVWLNIMKLRVPAGADYVIDDMRFVNEYEWLLKQRATLVRVERDPCGVDFSSSEGNLRSWPFHYVIHNTGTLSELKATVAQLHSKVQTEDYCEPVYL